MFYSLKKQHGSRMPVYSLISDQPNLTTGKITRTYRTVITFVVYVPKDIVKTLLSKAGDLVSFSVESGMVIFIGKDDLPYDYTPKGGDLIRYNNQVFSFDRVKYIPLHNCYAIQAIMITGESVITPLTQSLTESVTFTGGLEYVKQHPE